MIACVLREFRAMQVAARVSPMPLVPDAPPAAPNVSVSDGTVQPPPVVQPEAGTDEAMAAGDSTAAADETASDAAV